MKILVLGGTGAIGSDLVQILVQNQNEVFVTSRSERKTTIKGLTYIKGNAADNSFLNNLLEKTYYNSIVDFMAYSTTDFQKRVNMLLSSTDQYIFISSCRVFADSKYPITEESPRLLDICEDKKYLCTDEYALAKARQEDLLRDTGKCNWSIIRPYITYSNSRLQLGGLEKESWLYRALEGRSIVFNKEIADKVTTMTWGRDVAMAISAIIGKKVSLGQDYNITQCSTMKWKDVLDIYLESIKKVTNLKPKVIYNDSLETLGNASGRLMQWRYDRAYNRVFDNSKIARIYPDISNAATMTNGLNACMVEFLEGNRTFKTKEWFLEGYMDNVANEMTPVYEIKGCKNKLKYLKARCCKW